MKIVSLLLCIALTSLVRASDTVTVHLELAEITATEKVYNFTFENFDGIIAYQWALSFDPSGMSFKEARNIALEHLLPTDFHESTPGLLRSLYLNPTLQGSDHPDVFTAFQLVFALNSPGGSDVCLSETSIDYEFVGLQGQNEFTMNTLVMFDDCHQPFVLSLSPTAVDDQAWDLGGSIHHVYGQGDGLLTLTSDVDIQVDLSIVDLTGRVMADLGRHSLVSGRNTLQTLAFIPSGVYGLFVEPEKGKPQILLYFVR